MAYVDLPVSNLTGVSYPGDAYYANADDVAAAGDGKSAWVLFYEQYSVAGTISAGSMGLVSVPTDSVTSIEWVTVAYRESGYDHPDYDPGDRFSTETVPTVNVTYTGDGTTFAGRNMEPLPIGAFGGESTVEIPSTQWKYILADHPDLPSGFTGLEPTIGAGPGDLPSGSTGTIKVHIDYLAIRVHYATPAPDCEVRPGGVMWASGGGTSTVVGATPLGDNSDATYVELAATGGADVALPATPTGVVRPFIKAWVRAEGITENASVPGFSWMSVLVWTSDYSEYFDLHPAVDDLYIKVPVGGGPTQVNLYHSLGGTTARLMEVLATETCHVELGSSASTTRIFEFGIDGCPAVSLPKPPLRQYPRSDGLGASSARRMWPPPRSTQRSLRQGPGSHL